MITSATTPISAHIAIAPAGSGSQTEASATPLTDVSPSLRIAQPNWADGAVIPWRGP
jgi:hypothetical protein